jgi:hypothetical protein
MEDNSIPQKILKCLRPHNGKRLNVRFAGLLRHEVDQSIHICRKPSWTQLNWDNGNIILQYAIKNVVIDTDKIVELNPAYYSALAVRNEERQALLQNDELFEDTAQAINEYQAALKRLEELISQYRADKYIIKGLAGLE